MKDSSNPGISGPAPDMPKRLYRERISRAWSQKDLAAKIGTEAATVSRWERGGTVPSLYYRQQLCNVFGKSARELGFIQDDPQNISGKLQAPTAAQIEPRGSVGETRRALPRFSRSNLLLLCGIILLLAIGGTGIVYFVKRAVSVPPPVNAVATHGTHTSPPATSIRTYPPDGAKLVLNDPLVGNENGYNWGVDNAVGACQFSGGAYHITCLRRGSFTTARQAIPPFEILLIK